LAAIGRKKSVESGGKGECAATRGANMNGKAANNIESDPDDDDDDERVSMKMKISSGGLMGLRVLGEQMLFLEWKLHLNVRQVMNCEVFHQSQISE